MRAKKEETSKTDLLSEIEASASAVQHAELVARVAAERVKATDDVLAVKRDHAWKLLGSPFGSVRLGMFSFSKIMLIIAAAFFGMLVGSLLIGPVLGLLLVGIIVSWGVIWVRSKL